MHGFSSLLLGIECKLSLLSRAASVAVFPVSQALYLNLFIPLIIMRNVGVTPPPTAPPLKQWRNLPAHAKNTVNGKGKHVGLHLTDAEKKATNNTKNVGVDGKYSMSVSFRTYVRNLFIDFKIPRRYALSE